MRLLELDDLSKRELRVLDLAIEGLTDQQIAAQIGISTSTVNSYWVRVRGKLGHLSRTELVSRVLRQRTADSAAQAAEKIQELERQMSELRLRKPSSHTGIVANLAIEASPEPMLVLDEAGVILLASESCEVLFKTPKGEMVGRSISHFVVPLEEVLRRQAQQSRWLQPGKLGAKAALYGRRSDGLRFRLFLALDRSATTPAIWSCIIHPFQDEVESALERAALIIAEATAR